MPTLYAPPTQNALQKTLDAQLDAGVTAAATFNNMTGVQNLPGIFVVDRVDTNGVETPSKREYISFQTTSGSNVQTLVRGLAGSTDQDHAVGAIVEFIPDITWAQDLRDHLTTQHNTNGTHGAVTATSIQLGGSGATVTSVLDEDTLSSNSATALATQQSIKAYADSTRDPRTTTEVSSATPTINTDNTDIHTITALATAITSMTTNLSGTPVNGQKLIIRIKDDGTARAITWGASFASRGATLPTTTVLSKYQYNGFIYNSTTSTWDCVATVDEA